VTGETGSSYFIPVGVDFLAIEIVEPFLFSSHDCDLFVGNRCEIYRSFVFENSLLVCGGRFLCSCSNMKEKNSFKSKKKISTSYLETRESRQKFGDYFAYYKYGARGKIIPAATRSSSARLRCDDRRVATTTPSYHQDTSALESFSSFHELHNRRKWYFQTSNLKLTPPRPAKEAKCKTW
jgi:hypothetical protein